MTQAADSMGHHRIYVDVLFDGNQNTILLWQDISYGELVDASLKNIPAKNKVVIKGLASHGCSAKMIRRGRTDYAFGLFSYRIDGIEPINNKQSVYVVYANKLASL